MAEKIFLADKPTLDTVNANTTEIKDKFSQLPAIIAGKDYFTKDNIRKYVVGSTGSLTNTNESLMFHVAGPGYLYIACINTMSYSTNVYSRIDIDGVTVDSCSATSPSSSYNAIAGIYHTQLLNSYRYTVGTGTSHYTFLNTPRGSFIVNDDYIGRGLSNNTPVRGISTLIKPIRFEESLDIYSYTNTSNGTYSLQYAYLLD